CRLTGNCARGAAPLSKQRLRKIDAATPFQYTKRNNVLVIGTLANPALGSHGSQRHLSAAIDAERADARADLRADRRRAGADLWRTRSHQLCPWRTIDARRLCHGAVAAPVRVLLLAVARGCGAGDVAGGRRALRIFPAPHRSEGIR